MENFEPEDAKRQRIWARLSSEVREARLAEARRRLEAIREVARRPEGESERKATARVVTWAHRSSLQRWKRRHETQGFEGLVSWRIAPPSRMPEEVRQEVRTLARASLRVEAICAHLLEHFEYTTSASTVKGILREEGLARPRGRPPGKGIRGEQRLELGGMKLIEAVAQETGYVKALADAVMEHVGDLGRPAEPRGPDIADRDEYGRFLPTYNDRYRKGPDDAIGPGFASVATKREGMEPDLFQVSQVRHEIIERKLYGLLVSPLLGGGRWDGIRVPRGDLLGELCGFAYMPATLDKFTRELKYAGAASTLWEVHARLWLKQTREWGEQRRAVVVYVDGTTKPIWTRLFSQSTKVSSVGRTMPGLEQVAFHSGYGVPLWMVTHSGRAPLVTEVPKLLNGLEGMFGSSSVGRLLVIDAEANSVPFLKGLEAGKPSRSWVTRLRPGWVEGKRIFNRTNYRAYRDGDRVRVGVADFNDPEVEGGKFRMRVVEVERRTTGDVTYLGASTKLDEREWKAADIADLYFDRWPAQEGNFRAANQAAGLKEVHGYGKRLVDNVSVLTELDKLAGTLRGAGERLSRQQEKVEENSRRLREDQKVLARRQRRQQTVDRHLEPRLLPGRAVTPKTHEILKEQRALAVEVARRADRVAGLTKRIDEAQAGLHRTEQKLLKYRERKEVLESRRTIFAHDVELDSLFSLLKVGLVLLVTYALKELLGDARMEVSTFLERVATLPARLCKTPKLEIVTIEYNRRDADVMGLLQTHCDAINARNLRLRSGRRLRLVVEEAPPPARPPPPGSRFGSGERFVR